MESRSDAYAMACFVRVLLLMAAIFENIQGQTCGGNMIGSGRITSPNYPENAPNSIYCQWNLTADNTTGNDNVISIFFEDRQVKYHNDVLEIYSEGILMTRFQAERHTIQEYPKSVFGRSVTVVFRTGNDLQMSGFSMFFNSTAPECGKSCSEAGCFLWTPNFPNLHPKGSYCEWNISSNRKFLTFESTTVNATPFIGTLQIESTIGDSQISVSYGGPSPAPGPMVLENFATVKFTVDRCQNGPGLLMFLTRKTISLNEELFGNGTFFTPHYPYPYSETTVCVWRLRALTGLRIQLIMTDFLVEDTYDYVRVYSDTQLIGSYSGSRDPFSLTLGSEVVVVFQTDSNVEMRGFSASFISV